MDAKEMMQEKISAFSDGELAIGHVDIALAALRQEGERATWDVYHQISDVLCSDDLSCTMSADFSARFAARLAAEPTIIAPAISRHFVADKHGIACSSPEHGAVSVKRFRRFAIPGVATVAAAAAGLVFFTAPQLMVAKHEASAIDGVASVLVAAAPQSAGSGTQIVNAESGSERSVMLRDSNIDDYLSAHQRFSPSVYRTAQYARSAAFVTNSEK